jgi:hypothetical protein
MSGSRAIAICWGLVWLTLSAAWISVAHATPMFERERANEESGVDLAFGRESKDAFESARGRVRRGSFSRWRWFRSLR